MPLNQQTNNWTDKNLTDYRSVKTVTQDESQRTTNHI